MKTGTYRFFLSALWLVSMMNLASAGEFSAYISRDTAQASVTIDTALLGGPGGADLSTAIFFNDASDWMLNLGLKVSGTPAGEQPFVFGVGTRLYLGMLDEPNGNFQAMALGADARHVIPANMPVTIGLEGYYAPRVTTFGEGRELIDLGMRVELEVTPGAAGFVGYRYIQADIKAKRRYKMDDNLHFGIRLDF